SRRRHTRSKRDWSSDVCSSDLHFRLRDLNLYLVGNSGIGIAPVIRGHKSAGGCSGQEGPSYLLDGNAQLVRALAIHVDNKARVEIGRASCRERVWISLEEGRFN